MVNKGLITPIGKLKGAIHKWKNIGTSIYILQVIERGYGIPFKEIPKKCSFERPKIYILGNSLSILCAIVGLLLCHISRAFYERCVITDFEITICEMLLIRCECCT